MNVLFHATAAFGIAVLITGTQEKNLSPNRLTSVSGALIFGIISHSILDYMPHCYPLDSKPDAILSLILSAGVLILMKRTYLWIMIAALVGSFLPDIVDHTPEIINKYTALKVPVAQNLFPWHWKNYSGSIYTAECGVSNFNHMMILLGISIILWSRWDNLKDIFKRISH